MSGPYKQSSAKECQLGKHAPLENAGETASKPAGEPADEPAGKPAHEPADEPAEDEVTPAMQSAMRSSKAKQLRKMMSWKVKGRKMKKHGGKRASLRAKGKGKKRRSADEAASSKDVVELEPRPSALRRSKKRAMMDDGLEDDGLPMTRKAKTKAKAKASAKAKAKASAKAKAKASAKAKAKASGTAKAKASGKAKAKASGKAKAKASAKAKSKKGKKKPDPDDDENAEDAVKHGHQRRVWLGPKKWVFEILEDQVYGCSNCRFIFGGCKPCFKDSFRGLRAEDLKASESYQMALAELDEAGNDEVDGWDDPCPEAEELEAEKTEVSTRRRRRKRVRAASA